jgi:parallel beta-helix repeat protein
MNGRDIKAVPCLFDLKKKGLAMRASHWGHCWNRRGLVQLGLLILAGITLITVPAQAGGVVGPPGSCTYDDLIAAMAGGGLVTFNCGAAPVTIILTAPPGGVTPGPNTTIDGGGLITLSGNDAQRLFNNLAGSTFTLTNITLTNGFSNGPGGGIFNAGTLVLDTVIISNSEALKTIYGGGAVYNSGIFTAHNSTFSNNASAGGGAIYNDLGAKATIDNTSQIVGNTVTGLYGGGITNRGTMTMTNVLVDSNLVTGVSGFFGGGGIYSDGTLTVANSTISSNHARYGGGIFNDGSPGKLTLINVNVSNNTALSNGGGVLESSSGDVSISMTTISSNSALRGAGLSINGNRTGVILTDSTLKNNTAELAGGGMQIDNNGAITLRNNTISGNSARIGAGIWNDSSMIYMENDTISGNSAGYLGGGIYIYPGAGATLKNVTISGNSATTGGGIYSNTGGGGVIISNTIIAGSPSGGNCSGTITSLRYDISSDNTCALAGTGDLNNTDPKLSALGNYGGPTQVHMLLTGSLAIDGVDGSDAPVTDQRGYPRPAGSGYDIGAVERQATDSDFPLRVYLPLIRK